MSLRLRLTLAYVGLFAMALLALDIGLYFVVNRLTWVHKFYNKTLLRHQTIRAYAPMDLICLRF